MKDPTESTEKGHPPTPGLLMALAGLVLAMLSLAILPSAFLEASAKSGGWCFREPPAWVLTRGLWIQQVGKFRVQRFNLRYEFEHEWGEPGADLIGSVA
jgi:hypothetical protein